MMYKHKHCSALKDHLTYMQILQSAVCLHEIGEKQEPEMFFGGQHFLHFLFFHYSFSAGEHLF